MVLAESIEPVNGNAAVWDVRLRPGVEFNNGKPVTADDVIFSINRIINPKSPGTGAASIGYINAKGLKKLDARRCASHCSSRTPASSTTSGSTSTTSSRRLRPEEPGRDGGVEYKCFTPGQQSVFGRIPELLGQGQPYVDELTIIDFTDDTARINALLSGQIDIDDTVPTEQLAQLQGWRGQGRDRYQAGALAAGHDARGPGAVQRRPGTPGDPADGRPLADGGAGAGGQGSIGNDLYGPFDPAYDHVLPQRHQDIEQAKSLLKAAGRSALP